MTCKQSRAIQNMVANGGISWYRAMRMAGYSHAMARNPQKLSKSNQVHQYLNSAGISPEKAVLSLSEALDSGSILEKLVVARFCLRYT